jgi:nucleotide-binding universal stress UspA family protein
MQKVLLAVDGSDNSLRAVAYLVKRASTAKEQYQVSLVNVQYALHGTVATFINAQQLKQFHQEEGSKAIAQAQAALDAAGIACTQHLFIGEPAETITRFAREQACDEIIIGSRGLSAIGSLLVGSVATKIVHLAGVPVVLVK